MLSESSEEIAALAVIKIVVVFGYKSLLNLRKKKLKLDLVIKVAFRGQ